MKILIATPAMTGKGGTESVLLNLINNDKNNQYSLFIADMIGNRDWLNKFELDSKNISYNVGSNKIIKGLKLVSFLIRKKPDIVITLGTTQLEFMYSLRKKLRMKFKLVFWPHFSLDDEESVSGNNILKADYYLAISSGIKKQLIARGVNNKKIFLIFNPINKQDQTIKKSADGKTRFVMLSRIWYRGQKNIQEALHACANLHGNWSLQIYGDTDTNNGKELQKCQKLCQKLGIQDNVEFMGWSDNPWKQIDPADCLILSSTSEGFGLVLCEALSRGLPIISSNCPVGPDDIIKQGKNGFLYTLGNVDELANRMQLFIDHKFQYNVADIKSSIKEFYLNNYIKNIQKDFDQIENNKVERG